EGVEHITYREFQQAFFLPDSFLDAGIEVADGAGLECALPDRGRGEESGEIGCPVLAETIALLREDIYGEGVKVDRPARAEVGIIHRVIRVHVGEEAVPADGPGLADIKAGDVLGGEIFFCEEGFGPVRGVYQLREDILYMTIVECGD